MKKYKKKSDKFVVAVQLDLATLGFLYEKWGGIQVCKKGGWIVNNDGETYTVDEDSFAQTYEESGPGRYVKVGKVWAKQAEEEGEVLTKEGVSAYKSGDYVVYNNEDGTDGYAVVAEVFEAQYEEC